MSNFKRIWQGTKGRDYDPESRWFQVIRELEIDLSLPEVSSDEIHIAIIGFACEQGVINNNGRPGAKEGPKAIREALASSKLLLGKPAQIYDAGDIECNDGDLHSVQDKLKEAVAKLISKGYFPLAVGGGHEIAYPNNRGIAEGLAMKSNSKDFPKVNSINLIDAHSDVRPNKKDNDGNPLRSSGTPFRDIYNDHKNLGQDFLYHVYGLDEEQNDNSLFDFLKEINAKWLMDSDYNSSALSSCQDFINESENIHASICLDGIKGVRGVSAPARYGVDLAEILPILKLLAESQKVKALDIAEMAPYYDTEDNFTAKISASVINRFISYLTDYKGH